MNLCSFAGFNYLLSVGKKVAIKLKSWAGTLARLGRGSPTVTKECCSSEEAPNYWLSVLHANSYCAVTSGRRPVWRRRTVVLLYFPLRQDGTGFQAAIIPGESSDEAGVVTWANCPLLFTLRQVWPRQQKYIGEGSAHQCLSLQRRRQTKTKTQQQKQVKCQKAAVIVVQTQRKDFAQC